MILPLVLKRMLQLARNSFERAPALDAGALFHSQVRDYFWIGVLYREKRVAGVAVVRNRTIAVGRGVVSIVAAEAAGKIGVPEVVGIRAPGHAHRWKNILLVNQLHLRDGRGNRGLLVCKYVGIRSAVIVVQAGGNALGDVVMVRRRRLQRLDCFFLDKWKI